MLPRELLSQDMLQTAIDRIWWLKKGPVSGIPAIFFHEDSRALESDSTLNLP